MGKENNKRIGVRCMKILIKDYEDISSEQIICSISKHKDRIKQLKLLYKINKLKAKLR